MASFTVDAGTLLSLGLAFSLLPAAQLLATTALPKDISTKYKYVFIWHAYDSLTHFILEGSYLYHCFFSFAETANPSAPFFLGHEKRRYGAAYSSAPMARLWQEYAKADSRWGGSDLTIISLEILTVGLAGPCAAYIAYLIARGATGKTWFLAIVLATAELYGGFITFCPEWLSGNTSLAVDDPIFLWLYLVFFNVLWVFVPIWVLYVAWTEVRDAFAVKAKRE